MDTLKIYNKIKTEFKKITFENESEFNQLIECTEPVK